MPVRNRASQVAVAVVVIVLAACSNGQAPAASSARLPAAGAIDSARLVGDVARLADDSMRGRLTGRPEAAKARAFIAGRFDAAGLGTVGTGRLQPFGFTRRDSTRVDGVNVVGVVRGTASPERYLVVTAHYDHVGVRAPVEGDSIYNGADDNASGTAALLALAEHFVRQPARHSIIFVAFDAEEMGLQGAKAFVASLPVPRSSVVLNVNMDMVSVSTKGELYVAGASKYPRLRPTLERVAARAPVKLILGHDTPVPTAQDDWTDQSDQGAFHAVGIPFAYFGVEDHPYYHKPSDELSHVTQSFFVRAVATVMDAIRELDAS